MKPFQQYFHMVQLIYYVYLLLSSLWMQSYGMALFSSAFTLHYLSLNVGKFLES